MNKRKIPSRPMRWKHEPEAPKSEHPMALTPSTVRGVYGGGTRGAAPKGEPAKPGKRAPTADERRWMDAITEHGCIACRQDGRGYVPACVHHILRGGVRMGHLYTLPLCPPHHQHDTASGLIARHPFKTRFEQWYGDEMALLCKLRAEIGETA